jgi:hypothetical protein
MSSTDNADMIIEGFGLQDNIIAVIHRHKNGTYGPPLRLLRLLYDDNKLAPYGFSYCAPLRDKSSGNEDKPLLNNDGSEMYLFLSTDVHHFATVQEAHPAVILQCQKFLEVCK